MAETDPHIATLLKGLAPYAPGVGGVVLSLLFGERLTVRGKIVSGVGGLAAVKWIAPAICLGLNPIVPGPQIPIDLANMVGFLTGCFGMIILSGLAQALATYAKDPLKLVKVQLGPVSIGTGGAE